jgi:hypothetical protein
MPKRHIAAAVFSIFVVTPVSFMAFDKAPVLEFHGAGSVSPDPIAPGGTATIIWDATVLRRCDGRVNRQLIHESGIVTDYEWAPVVFRDNAAIGSRQRYQRTFQVPTLPGKYRHVANVERWCNPLQYWFPALRIKEQNTNLPFVVSKP